MPSERRRLALTFVGVAVLLALILWLNDLLAWDVFIVLLAPFLVLGAVGMRPILHWTLFVVMAAVTVLTLFRVEQSESSTAGFGVVVVPVLLSVAALVAAAIDRLFAAR
jgi:hypothetical protein